MKLSPSTPNPMEDPCDVLCSYKSRKLASSKWIIFYKMHKQLPSKHTTSQKRRYNVAATSWRCSDVVTTLLRRCVFAGYCVFHMLKITIHKQKLTLKFDPLKPPQSFETPPPPPPPPPPPHTHKTQHTNTHAPTPTSHTHNAQRTFQFRNKAL